MASDPRNHVGRRITALTGVYDAEGSLRGELTYWVGARLGRRHCALCDITHGTFRANNEWKVCAAGLPVAFDAVHLDERSPEVRAATEGRVPCVVAHLSDGTVTMLVGADALDACAGSGPALVDAIDAAAEAAGLSWA
jgi:hypothetical protein